MEATPALVRELAPTGRLRTTINLGNVVLAQRDEAPANWVALRFGAAQPASAAWSSHSVMSPRRRQASFVGSQFRTR